MTIALAISGPFQGGQDYCDSLLDIPSWDILHLTLSPDWIMVFGRTNMRVFLALASVVLLTVCPAVAQHSEAPAKANSAFYASTMMSKVELASFFRTLAADLPRWRAAVASDDPTDYLNVSYAMGKLIEQERSGFLNDCDYLQHELMFKPSIKVQIVTLGILANMMSDLEDLTTIYSMSGAVSEKIGQAGKELGAVHFRLTSHLAALGEKLDSTVDLDKLLP
jgi:hypothetical protein